MRNDESLGDTNAFFTYFDENPFHRYIGLSLAEISDDSARLRLKVTDSTPTGIGGSVNGGVLATMVDMAAVAAVFSKAMAGSEPAGTADLSITYLRQAHGEWLDAVATVIKRGRQLSTFPLKSKMTRGGSVVRARCCTQCELRMSEMNSIQWLALLSSLILQVTGTLLIRFEFCALVQ